MQTILNYCKTEAMKYEPKESHMQTEKQNHFVELTQDCRSLVYTIINKYCIDVNYRDDLYHDIILRAWKSFDSFNGTRAFSSWICSVARHTAIDRLRRIKHGLVELHHDNPIYSVIDEPYSEQPLPVLSTLSQKEIQTINLYIEGLTPKQIGEKLGEPANRVAVRMKRIKDRLAKQCKNKKDQIEP